MRVDDMRVGCGRRRREWDRRLVAPAIRAVVRADDRGGRNLSAPVLRQAGARRYRGSGGTPDTTGPMLNRVFPL